MYTRARTKRETKRETTRERQRKRRKGRQRDMSELVHASSSLSHHLKVVNWNVLGDCYAFGQDNAANMCNRTLLWEYR